MSTVLLVVITVLVVFYWIIRSAGVKAKNAGSRRQKEIRQKVRERAFSGDSPEDQGTRRVEEID